MFFRSQDFKFETHWAENFAIVHHANSCRISSGNIETNSFVVHKIIPLLTLKCRFIVNWKTINSERIMQR